MRPVLTMITIGVMLWSSVSAMGQDEAIPGADWTFSQRETAVQAARAEAELKLMEHVWNLSLGKGRSVASVLNNDPASHGLLVSACSGAVTEVGQPVFDATQCEVQVSIPVVRVVEILERFRIESDVPNTLTPDDAVSLAKTMAEAEIESLVADGKGDRPAAPRWQAVTKGASVDSDEYLRGRVKDFWTLHSSEQGRIRAVMAAQDDATVKLAEKIGRVHVGPDRTALADVVAPEEFIAIAQSEFTSDIRAAEVRYYTESLQVDVTIEASLSDILLTLKGYLDKQAGADEATVVMLEDEIINVADKRFSAVGSADVDPEFVLVGNDPVFLLARWVDQTDEPMFPESLGTCALKEDVEDPEGARESALERARFNARLGLPGVLDAIVISDDDETVTLGSLSDEYEIVDRALMLLALEAETLAGSVDAEGQAKVTVQASLSRLPVVLRALRRVEEASPSMGD
jgi:hypothetical protein